MKRGQYKNSIGRYVTFAEEAEISLLRQWFAEEALDTTRTPEAMPAACTGDFGPLWATCPGGRPCDELAACSCAGGRADAVLRARMHVLEMRTL